MRCFRNWRRKVTLRFPIKQQRPEYDSVRMKRFQSFYNLRLNEKHPVCNPNLMNSIEVREWKEEGRTGSKGAMQTLTGTIFVSLRSNKCQILMCR